MAPGKGCFPEIGDLCDDHNTELVSDLFSVLSEIRNLYYRLVALLGSQDATEITRLKQPFCFCSVWLQIWVSMFTSDAPGVNLNCG